MSLISLALTIVWAVHASTVLGDIPVDLIRPIVSYISSHQELVALNRTSKAFYPSLRPIFDFESACQVYHSHTWQLDRMLIIRADDIDDVNVCAIHLMHYSSLYKTVSIEGDLSTVIALFRQITASLEVLIDVDLYGPTLNMLILSEFIQSIGRNSVNLFLEIEKLEKDMIDLLADTINRHITPFSPFTGINFNFASQLLLPPNLLTRFFEALPNSKLQQLSITGRLYVNGISQLSAVLPLSKLTSLSIRDSNPRVSEMEALGSAMVRTPSLKKIIIHNVGSSNAMLHNMTTGLRYSFIEELEITDGDDMEASVALIKSFPASMTDLNLSHGGYNRIFCLTTPTFVNLVRIASHSNLKMLDLAFNHAHLQNATDVQQITDAILGSQLEAIYLEGNEIDAKGDAILEPARKGRLILSQNYW